jgi:hypothetical protein
MRQSRNCFTSHRCPAIVHWLWVSVIAIGCAPNVVVESGRAAMKQVDGNKSVLLESSSESLPLESPSVATPENDAPGIASAATLSELEAGIHDVQQANPARENVTTSLLRTVIAVCPQSFREALAPWVKRREREGLEVRVIDSQATAKQLKSSLIEIASDHCRYILLVGDSSYSPNDEPLDANVLVPTLYRTASVTAKYQQTPLLPGDYAFGDFNDDGIAEASVGRLPVKTAGQLASVINRIIAYEDNTHFGDWRSRVDLVAGIGGFGPMIDGAIEMVAGGIITGSLPGFVRTRITHASPTSDFHPGVDQFTSTVLKNYREGARFWVYAGHGWVNELDRVPATQFGRPVLSTSDVPELRCDHDATPIALMLACYTGAFDADQDCLAEQMMLADQGPIAVLAGSRVTMPYGNAAAAVGLIHAVYYRKAERLGDAWSEALREMATSTQDDPELRTRRAMIDGIASLMGGGSSIDEERREHMQLYNWLGDPTLRLSRDEEVQFSTEGDLTAGKPFVIRGTTPIAGKLSVEVHRRLGSPISTLVADRNDIGTKYLAANETLLCRDELELTPGDWTCTMLLPEDEAATRLSTTPVIIRAKVVSETGFATGSQTAWLRPEPKSKNSKSKSTSAAAAATKND